MWLLQKSNSKQSSRQQINIQGVTDGILTLPGNQYRLVLQSSSINFELKSEDEQDALIDTYQSFLNSLASPLQIVVRVRELDMDKYLEDFKHDRSGEQDEIYRLQAKNYAEFVQSLVTTNKILSRHFYIVLPYDNKDGNSFSFIQEQLALNADIVSKGLGRLGIRTRQLTSLEVLDLFYSFYNPKQAKRQPITDQTLQLLKANYL
jgi:hypothetical protein